MSLWVIDESDIRRIAMRHADGRHAPAHADACDIVRDAKRKYRYLRENRGTSRCDTRATSVRRAYRLQATFDKTDGDIVAMIMRHSPRE
jgi:hypothetical protein